MIGLSEIYKVVTAMAPLYVALALGCASVKWCRMFNRDHSDAINRFNCFFIIPFFNFQFMSHINTNELNYRFLGGDVVAKCLILAVLAFWANCSGKGNYVWSITAFSLGSLNNTLILGVPLLTAMYGGLGQDLVIQSSIMQLLVWIAVLLFMLEYRRERLGINDDDISGLNGDLQIPEVESGSYGNGQSTVAVTVLEVPVQRKASIWSILNNASLKLVKNPNFYGAMIGIIWALFSSRWHLKMPEIIEQSILIMSKMGAGVAMFSIGMFTALQEKVLACGTKMTLLAMVLRFVIGPATVAIGCVACGLRGKVLRIALIQAALPQSVASFVFAQEYVLHPDVISAGVILGTVLSLPLLIAYYAILETMP